MILTHRTNPDQIKAYLSGRAHRLAMERLNRAATPKRVDYSAVVTVATYTYLTVVAALVGALLALA